MISSQHSSKHETWVISVFPPHLSAARLAMTCPLEDVAGAPKGMADERE